MLLAAVGLAPACATPRAQVETAPPPPLVVPVPPPRIILPPDPALPAVAEVPESLVESPPPRPSRPAHARSESSRTGETPRVSDGGNGDRAVDGATAAVEAPVGTPPEDAADQDLRRQLQRAFQDLQRVDYAMLSNDLKAQYDTARRFIVLGEQALKERNRLFAATLADKANAIASSLLRR